MKGNVRTINGTEYIGGDISLIHGFVKITKATQRELTLEKVANKDMKTWKGTLRYYFFFAEPFALKHAWRTVKKNASIILPASTVAWIAED